MRADEVREEGWAQAAWAAHRAGELLSSCESPEDFSQEAQLRFPGR